MVKLWYRLPRDAVSTLGDIVKTQLGKVLGSLQQLTLLRAGGWTRGSPEAPACVVLCDSVRWGARSPSKRVLCRKAVSLPPLLCYGQVSVGGPNKHVAAARKEG